MGTCESLFNNPERQKNNKITKEDPKLKNKGSNLFCAPIDSSINKNNLYSNNNSISQNTITMDMSQYPETQKPPIYQYINKYKSNGLQRSIAKASLVELGGQGNSLMYSNIKNSGVNQINSFYTSRCDDTGYESSYEGLEMIIDGKMDEELVQKSNDKNTIDNYNEFIKKKEGNKDNSTNGNKVMDYYKRSYKDKGKNLEVINEENKDGDDLSRISSGEIKKKNKVNGNNNVMQYIQSMGKY